MIVVSGGVKTPFNLEFVGSPTAPAVPRENMIWVKTDIPISQWLMTRVAGAWQEVPGAVNLVYESSYDYRMTGPSTLIYNGKLHGIYGQFWIMPLALYQSEGPGIGFRSRDAYIYKSGTWVQFSWAIVWLYKSDVDFNTVTGGWKGFPYHHIWDGNRAPGVAMEANAMKISFPSATGGGSTGSADYWKGTVFTNKQIDVTSFKTLRITVDKFSTVKTTYLVLAKTLAKRFTAAAVCEFRAAGTYTLDVSNLSGAYYVGINDNVVQEYDGSTVWVKEIALQ